MRHRSFIIGAAFLLLCAVAAVFFAGAVLPGGTSTARAADQVVLTITGNGQTKTFTMAELQALPAYTGWSGLKNSAGTITVPAPVKGVKLTDLLGFVGRPDGGAVGRRDRQRQLRHDVQVRRGRQRRRHHDVQRDHRRGGDRQVAGLARRDL